MAVTSLTIAFTSMVLSGSARWDNDFNTNAKMRFAEPIPRIAFPNLIAEAHRLSYSIQYRSLEIAFVTLGIFGIVVLGHIAEVGDLIVWLRNAHLLAEAALRSGTVPALLGILGALASILRRFQHLAGAQLLYRGCEAKIVSRFG